MDYVQRLRQLGIRELGHGYYAHVFQHPTIASCAVKVVEACDEGYLYFMSWSMAHQDNPYVPRFYDATHITVDDGSKYVIIFMEKLGRISEVEYGKFLAKVNTTLVLGLYSVDTDPALYELLTCLLAKPLSIDLRQGNLMKRGDQVVCVDPFAGC